MRKRNLIKLTVALSLMSFGSTTWAKRIAFGAANMSACEVFGNQTPTEKAKVEAKTTADEECNYLSHRKVEAVIDNLEVIDSYRGSCWAGTNSGVAIKVSYSCKYN